MNHVELSALLAWCAPRLGLRWRGFSNVRGQVEKRIARRIRELQLADVAAYRARLHDDPAEWVVLERLCVVTLSRFYRDAAVWQALEREVLPQLAASALAAEEPRLRCWSVGCASGEEPYTLAIVWVLTLAERFPGLDLRVLATDRHEPVLSRAARARYGAGTLRELPAAWRAQAFQSRDDGQLSLREPFRRAVELRAAEASSWQPAETFRLILCRNVVFTYFDEARQRTVLQQLVSRLAAGGGFAVAPREQLPESVWLEPWRPELGLYRRTAYAAEAQRD